MSDNPVKPFHGDCRDDANFGKPFTDADLDRIRSLQAARLRYQDSVIPVHPATAADSRWLATVDALTSRLDAATRRADEVGALLREAQPHLIARTLSPTPHPWEVRDERAKAELLAKIDAALSTGSTPATTANPGDKADRIDAAKEGR